MTKNFSEKRRHPRMPVISNLIEPVNLHYKTQDGKETSLVAILADLSASGMRMISFLGAPLADRFSISLQLPGTDKMEVEAKLAWVKQRENVYTINFNVHPTAPNERSCVGNTEKGIAFCKTMNF